MVISFEHIFSFVCSAPKMNLSMVVCLQENFPFCLEGKGCEMVDGVNCFLQLPAIQCDL